MRFFAPTALALALAARAAAGTLATPVFYAKDNEIVTCSVANTGTKNVKEVLVELVSFDSQPGTVVQSSGVPADLAPLASLDTSKAGGPGFVPYVCRFSFKGSGKTLRGSMAKIDTGFVVLDSLPAL